MRKLILFCALVATIGCATLRKNSIPVQEQITSLLGEISNQADKAFDSPTRKLFAQQIMLPAIADATKLNDCLLHGDCKNLTVTLTDLSRLLLSAINDFAAKLPSTLVAKQTLINAINSVISFVTNLYVKFGGKTYELVNQDYSTLVLQKVLC